MRVFFIRIISLSILATGVYLRSGGVNALSCIQLGQEGNFFLHDTIYIAEILEVKELPETTPEGHNISYNIRIIKSYKGDKKSGRYTARGKTDDIWGFNTPLTVGGIYLIYGDSLSIGGCSENRLVSENFFPDDLEKLASRKENPKFQLYMKVKALVNNYLNNNYHTNENKEKIRTLRGSVKKNRLEKHTTCDELTILECRSRFDSCVYEHPGTCRAALQEEVDVIKNSYSLCTNSGGTWQASGICECNQNEPIQTMTDIHEYMVSGRTLLRDKEKGCVSERKLCEGQGGTRTSEEFKETNQTSTTTAEGCLGRSYESYVEKKEAGTVQGYPFHFTSVYSDLRYWNYDKNTCIHRRYEDRFPGCTPKVTNYSMGK